MGLPLPIYAAETAILEGLSAHRRVVLQAPTGSGKSTQVPQMLLRHGWLDAGQVVVLQPRRLAARLLATRVAAELGTPLGREVGYQVRFERVEGPQTRIKFVTEGVLLRQWIENPTLVGIRGVIFDEFHERHLYGDVTLARALQLQTLSRPDLFLAVMSATLDSEALQAYLRPCAVVRASGRTFPVDIEFAARRPNPETQPVWDLAAEAFARHAASHDPEDVLIFMPGSYEIHKTLAALRDTSEARGYALLPLHGELPAAEQDAAVAPQDRPKIVVATNVAETSLTIDGVKLVIDSGLARIARHDPHRGINTLFVEPISQSSADQRTGRAGRTAPGRCVRLWTEADHRQRPSAEHPEIRRLDLSEMVLTLKATGVPEVRSFPWFEAPPETALAHAEELLADLGALDHSGAITAVGRGMVAFPLHPRYSRMLLAAHEYGCVRQAALIAALTQDRDLLVRNPGRDVLALRQSLFGETAVSDFWILMRAWSYARQNGFRTDACRKLGIHALTARQVGPVADQFLRIAERQGLSIADVPPDDTRLQRCILAGFSDRVARRLDAGTLRCELVHQRRGVLARESVVHETPLFVAADVREVQGADRSVTTVLGLATAVDPDWLRELYPDDWATGVSVTYDSSSRRVIAEERTTFRGLVLSSRALSEPPPDQAAALLATEVLAGRLALRDWDHEVEQWIHRLNCLAAWCPELALPPIGDAERRDLTIAICHGVATYRELKDQPVKPVIQDWLSADQRPLLERHAPARLELPNGRRPRIVYETGALPHIALRIQELFGVHSTPRIAMNRVPVVVHILAPSMRPVQVTQDLAGFWREHYPRIKQELQRKYPKHEWR